jgi:transposase
MNEPVEIITERIDDVVVLLHVMKQMKLAEMLNEHLPRHWKQAGLDWGWVVVIWLSYILSEGDHRKVVVREWVSQRQQTIEQVCGLKISGTDFSDDRLSIVLRHMSVGSRWALIESALNERTLSVYNLSPERVRLDATTVSGKHLVSEDGLFQFGHSKDDARRPQVKVMMADLDPMGMPLATQVVSGEQGDDGLYIPIFEQVRLSLGKPGLLWVGDSKMGALATRRHIHEADHYYLVPLARTGQVPELLRQTLSEMRRSGAVLESVALSRIDGTEGACLSGYVTERVVESQTGVGDALSWTEQLFLVHSPSHEQKQAEGLAKRIATATTKLLALTPTVGRGHKQISDATDLEQKATAILNAHRLAGLLDYTFELHPPTKTQQARYQITAVTPNQTALVEHQQEFGWRLYVSNAPASALSLAQAVSIYREEWIVEHGFHRFKGKSLGADPLFVQRDDQVVGLLNLLSLGLRLLTLIEFVVHRQLTQTQQTLTGLYPENPKKSTNRPSTERILKVFDQMTLTIFTVEGQSHRHLPPLTPLQLQIIQLLGFSPHIYTDLLALSG